MVKKVNALEEFTDYIKERNFIIGFGFLLDKLDDEMLYKNVLQSLLIIQKSPNKFIRERSFNIWCGIHLNRYYIALLENTTVKIINIFRKTFELHFSDISTSYGETSHIGLYPLYRYDNGTIIEYNDDSVAGKTRIDDENWYGTGAKIHFRLCCRAELLGCDIVIKSNQ